MEYGLVLSCAAASLALVACVIHQRRSKSLPASAQKLVDEQLRDFHDVAPQTAKAHDVGGQQQQPYHWGRYKQALSLPDVEAPTWRLKQWHHHTLQNGRWFVGLAVVNLGYVANAWVYLIDRESPKSISSEYRALVPLGIGVSLGSSSMEGTATWKSRGNRIAIQADSHQGWSIELSVTVDGKLLEGHCTISQPEESLALLYPLEGVHQRRAAYTHKAAGMPVEGSLRWGDQELQFNKADSFATLDWTRSYARRTTIWKWASFSGLASQGQSTVRVGLNLSAEVYDDKENSLWLNGKVYVVGPVTFTLPKRVTQDPWTVCSSNGALRLEFVPHAAREEHLNVIMVASKFSQVGGVFSGTIDLNALTESGSVDGEHSLITVENILGVVETHYAVW